MPANTSPIFTLTPNVGEAAASAANTKSDGAGTVATDIFKAFTAGANGSFVTKVRFNPVSSAAATSTTATVGRVFLSTVGTGATTNANTWLLGEVALPSVSADHSTAPTNPIELMLNIAIPTGSFIHITNHAAPAASTLWQATVFGGDY
jgi:hypothetical protein